MQYLYCDSNHPHRLSGIYPLGTTCANLSGAVYTAGYDAFGNENYRSYQNVTASLFYDSSNHLVEWNAGSSGQEFYVYDAAGNRVLQRSISGGVTRLMVSAFGLQDLAFGYNGYVAGQTDYYSLAGHLIGEFNGTATTYNLTDALGSVLTSFSKSAVIGEQTYGPYGNQRYSVGTIGTSKGYTGQLHDSITNLDYYNARYYDPVAGVFLSPDSVQGNGQGMDPYAYVAGNPETATDPTGKMVMCGAGDGCGGGDSSSGGSSFSIGNIVSGILSGSGGFSGGCGSSHAEANACIMRKGSISKSECDAKCAAKAKPVAQSAAQKLRNMASQVQGILDGFAHCADLDFNCIVHELGNDMLNGSKIGGPIGTLIGGIIGCLTTFAIGCIPGITVGTAIGNLIGAVGGLGYFVYAEFVEHSTVSMLQSLQQLLNSGASDFEHQQLDDSQDPTLYPREELASQDEAFDEAVGNFTVGNNGELGDKANAIAYQALSIYDGAVNSELNYFAN